MWKPDVCVYHGNCDDGFGAAWAIWKRWPDIEFISGVYGKPLEEPADGWSCKNVLFVDYSLPEAEMRALAEKCASIAVLDHHKTAQAALAPFVEFNGTLTDLKRAAGADHAGAPAVYVHFDMDRSGAPMAWEFAHGDTPLPNMLRLIEDRDLWRFKYPETAPFSAGLRIYPQDFGVWSQIEEMTSNIIEEGDIVLRSHRANIAKFINDVVNVQICGHDVPAVNVPYHYASDVAHAMLHVFPDAPFAASWFMRGDGKIQFSLRSTDDKVDVSEIAKRFGGGGHRNAAGFQLDWSDLLRDMLFGAKP